MTEYDPEAAETRAPQPVRLYRLNIPGFTWHIFVDCQTLKTAATRRERAGEAPPKGFWVEDIKSVAEVMALENEVCLRCRRRWERGRR